MLSSSCLNLGQMGFPVGCSEARLRNRLPSLLLVCTYPQPSRRLEPICGETTGRWELVCIPRSLCHNHGDEYTSNRSSVRVARGNVCQALAHVPTTIGQHDRDLTSVQSLWGKNKLEVEEQTSRESVRRRHVEPRLLLRRPIRRVQTLASASHTGTF